MTATLLAIDQGTSATKAVLLDEGGDMIARASASLSARYPRAGWVEQDADEIWASVLGAIAACLREAPGAAPAAIAIANQRETAVAWRRADGAPAGPAIGWQDSRGAAECDRLRADGHEALVRGRTGLTLDPMFSATKLRALLEAAPGGLAAAERGELCAGTVDAWLVWKLTDRQVFACEAGNASRTLLMDLRAARWDDDLLALFGVPAPALPEIRRSDGGFGTTLGVPGIGDGTPIAAVLADSHAALYGHGCLQPGMTKATFGTGTSVMTIVDAIDEPTGAVAQTLAWLTGAPAFALEGNIIATGGALDWMGETLGIGSGAGLEALASGVPTTAGVHFVPAFAGLGAPWWDRSAQGVITGLTRGTTRAHLARAALEAVAFQVCDVVEAMEACVGLRLRELHADGGATGSDTLMQLVADLSERTVHVSRVADVSAIGAAHLAGRAIGMWDDQALRALPRPRRAFAPRPDAAGLAARRAAWRAAVDRARGRRAVRDVQDLVVGATR